jgi:hypothetical protein
MLAKGWRSRLVRLAPGDTGGVKALCLEPHDLAIAKYVASRQKDLIFNRELIRRGILTRRTLMLLLEDTPVGEEKREQIRSLIDRDFSQVQIKASQLAVPAVNLLTASLSKANGTLDV